MIKTLVTSILCAANIASHDETEPAVAERLARSPPTRANRVRSPAGSPPGFFAGGNRARTTPLVGGFFSRISRFPRPFIPTLLHVHLASPSSVLETTLSKSAQMSSLTHSRKDHNLPSPGVGCFRCTASTADAWPTALPGGLCCDHRLKMRQTDLAGCAQPISVSRHRTEFLPTRATVTERLAWSPPTKAIRVQPPTGSLPDFHMTMPLVGGFSRGSPVSPALSFWCGSILTTITLTGSQDLDMVKRREYGKSAGIQGTGNGRSPSKPTAQRYRPTRFPHTIIRERPRQESDPVRLGGRRPNVMMGRDERHSKLKLHLEGCPPRRRVGPQMDPVQSFSKRYIVSAGVIVPNTVPPGKEIRWYFGASQCYSYVLYFFSTECALVVRSCVRSLIISRVGRSKSASSLTCRLDPTAVHTEEPHLFFRMLLPSCEAMYLASRETIFSNANPDCCAVEHIAHYPATPTAYSARTSRRSPVFSPLISPGPTLIIAIIVDVQVISKIETRARTYTGEGEVVRGVVMQWRESARWEKVYEASARQAEKTKLYPGEAGPDRYGVLRADEDRARRLRVGRWHIREKNPMTNGIVRHDSHVRTPPGLGSRFALVPYWLSGQLVRRRPDPALIGERSSNNLLTSDAILLACAASRYRRHFHRHDGNTARLARRSDEALGVRVSVARIASSLLDLGRWVPTIRV
ncbi:hypothetical protein PR048_018533 [Dryococelus australis]|uniref:Uncharacterized protein n=1 Tax=Dryococelus australis TaxID=614101 RepID=A0ABQ9HCH8_9NEOP|nr:hypothetical protein PR048_018533 [Dryococelus australis]